MIPIVVIAYNRPKSLLRLLTSLSKANYDSEEVELIISIDKGNNQEVLDIANEFIWKYGTKNIFYQQENLGLRKHVIKCASLASKYGSIILLEDDLYVSPSFYKYTRQALEFSKNKDYIGGISLYNHQSNVLCAEPFTAINDGFDNYYFQFASSWGQAWTKKQWEEFKKWYDENSNINLESDDFPSYIANWPSSSWLKYFMKYLVYSGKFFLYPRVSLTTNFGDKGTHMGGGNSNYQVPLEESKNHEYYFSTLEESNSVYDIFYENLKLVSFLGVPSNQICIDLYGNKIKRNERYYLTRKTLNFKIISNFGRNLRPHDANIFEDINGSDFSLYDTSIKTYVSRKKIKNMENYRNIQNANYCFKFVPREKHIILFKIFYKNLSEGIFRRLLNRK